MEIKNWIACVQDQGKWKEVVEKAKTFNEEVQHLEEEEEAGQRRLNYYTGRCIKFLAEQAICVLYFVVLQTNWCLGCHI